MVEDRTRPRVLLVDCDRETDAPLPDRLRREGFHVTCVPCGAPVLAALERAPYDAVLLRPCEPGEKGLNIVARARALQEDAVFILLADDDSLATAVGAIRLGAFDYLPRPARADRVARTVRRALAGRGRRRIPPPPGPGGMVGRSWAMERVKDLVRRVAPTDLSVLVTGETGTGKELVCRAIHELSPRKDRGMVAVSCATVPDHLMEPHLFGHVRGAFTGAVESRRGLFEQCPGGTVLLDEVDTVDLGLQAKLLRVLEARTIHRVGDLREIPVDFRLVASTNVDLAAAVEEERFRADLWYRLNVFPIHVPPLRSRPEDIPLLALHFRDRFAQACDMDPLEFTPCCMDRLCRHSWPGNVRELKHTVERALLISADEGRITCRSVAQLDDDRFTLSWSRALEERWSLARLERSYIESVLERTGGRKGAAAEILGVDRSTLYRKLRSYGPPTGRGAADDGSRPGGGSGNGGPQPPGPPRPVRARPPGSAPGATGEVTPPARPR